MIDSILPRQRLALEGQSAAQVVEQFQLAGLGEQRALMVGRPFHARCSAVQTSVSDGAVRFTGGPVYQIISQPRPWVCPGDAGASPTVLHAEALLITDLDDELIAEMEHAEPGAAAAGAMRVAAAVRIAAGLEPLVRRWEALVRAGRERQPGQIDQVRGDLGPMPVASRPSERAVWVAALINPLPGLGVARGCADRGVKGFFFFDPLEHLLGIVLPPSIRL